MSDQKRVSGYRPPVPPPRQTRDQIMQRNQLGPYSEQTKVKQHHNRHQHFQVGFRHAVGWIALFGIAIPVVGTSIAVSQGSSRPNQLLLPETSTVSTTDPKAPVPNDKISQVALVDGQQAALKVCGDYRDADGNVTHNTIATADSKGHLRKAQVNSLGNLVINVGLGQAPIGMSPKGGWVGAKGELREEPLACSTVLAEANTYKAPDGSTKIHLVPDEVLEGAMVKGPLQEPK